MASSEKKIQYQDRGYIEIIFVSFKSLYYGIYKYRKIALIVENRPTNLRRKISSQQQKYLFDNIIGEKLLLNFGAKFQHFSYSFICEITKLPWQRLARNFLIK